MLIYQRVPILTNQHLSINTGAHTAQAWSRLAAWRRASRPAETLISWTIVQPWDKFISNLVEYLHQNPPEFEAWIDISSIFLTCLSHVRSQGHLAALLQGLLHGTGPLRCQQLDFDGCVLLGGNTFSFRTVVVHARLQDPMDQLDT